MREKDNSDRTLSSMRAGIAAAAMIVIVSFAAATVLAAIPIESDPVEAAGRAR